MFMMLMGFSHDNGVDGPFNLPIAIMLGLTGTKVGKTSSLERIIYEQTQMSRYQDAWLIILTTYFFIVIIGNQCSKLI